MAEITMRQLLKAGVHFGHQTRYWAPKMAPYIFGDRNKIHIINLEKTLPMMQEAMNYLGSIAAQGGKILFVGTKRQAGQLIRENAVRSGCSYVDHRWLGGMLTNYKTVKNSIARLKELEQRFESGAIARLSKKEALNLERERTKLDKTLSGIKDMNGLPDVVFIIDVEQEYIAVAEANKLGIPVVAVVDTNCSLDGIDYIIPGNDDSTRAIKLYLEAAADSVIEARAAVKPVAVVAGDDEYIEVDETGEVVDQPEVKAEVKVARAKKLIVKEAPAGEVVVEEIVVEEVAVEVTVADEVKQTLDSSVEGAIDEPAADGGDTEKEAESVDKEQAAASDTESADEQAVSEKKPAGKKASKKKAAGKTASKKKVVRKKVVRKKTASED